MGQPRQKDLALEERKGIEKYLKMGFSHAKIAEKLARSKTAVTNEIKRSGGADGYNAKKSQLMAEERLKEKYLKLSKMNKGKSSYINHTKRIEHIEMQIEIILDTLKELVNR